MSGFIIAFSVFCINTNLILLYCVYSALMGVL